MTSRTGGKDHPVSSGIRFPMERNMQRDEYGITYIIFTIEEIMNLMNLGNKKVNKMVKELEEHGLIYRRHQGLGRPNKI